jgi:hypothetical protein
LPIFFVAFSLNNVQIRAAKICENHQKSSESRTLWARRDVSLLCSAKSRGWNQKLFITLSRGPQRGSWIPSKIYHRFTKNSRTRYDGMIEICFKNGYLSYVFWCFFACFSWCLCSGQF